MGWNSFSSESYTENIRGRGSGDDQLMFKSREGNANCGSGGSAEGARRRIDSPIYPRTEEVTDRGDITRGTSTGATKEIGGGRRLRGGDARGREGSAREPPSDDRGRGARGR